MKTFPLKNDARSIAGGKGKEGQVVQGAEKAGKGRYKGAAAGRPAKHKYKIVHYNDVRII